MSYFVRKVSIWTFQAFSHLNQDFIQTQKGEEAKAYGAAQRVSRANQHFSFSSLEQHLHELSSILGTRSLLEVPFVVFLPLGKKLNYPSYVNKSVKKFRTSPHSLNFSIASEFETIQVKRQTEVWEVKKITLQANWLVVVLLGTSFEQLALLLDEQRQWNESRGHISFFTDEFFSGRVGWVSGRHDPYGYTKQKPGTDTSGD